MLYIDHLVLRNVWVSSFILSLSLLGDALLYVILPVHADAFGVSLAMVGFLLAINRIIRTFAYGFIAHIAEQIGLKKLCFIASTTAVVNGREQVCEVLGLVAANFGGRRTLCPSFGL